MSAQHEDPSTHSWDDETGWDPAGSWYDEATTVFQRLWRAAQLGVHPHLVVRPDELELGPCGQETLDRLVSELVINRLTQVFERGWQPLDVIHVATRAGASSGRLAAWMIVRQADLGALSDEAPAAWTAQLDLAADLVADLIAAGPQEWLVTGALRSARSTFADAIVDGCRLAATVQRLPRLEPLLPGPSQWGQPLCGQMWGQPMVPRATTAGPVGEKVLGRIRALLAKAESTAYAAEAESLTAKAQELMTRHAIDAARVGAGLEQLSVDGRRVHLDAPYPLEKATLLDRVARANRSKAVYLDAFAIATVVGTPADLDVIEMLFTSLLIQATRAMTDQAATAPAGSAGRTRSFRRTFLTAYAVRIGERLSEVNATVATSAGTDLVPLFARQEAAVNEEYARLFPRTVSKGSRTLLDDRGWRAGTAAADRATFTAGGVTA